MKNKISYNCWQCDKKIDINKKPLIFMTRIIIYNEKWFGKKLRMEMYNQDGYQFCSKDCFGQFVGIFID